MAKGEIARCVQFLLLSLCLQKAVYMRERIKFQTINFCHNHVFLLKSYPFCQALNRHCILYHYVITWSYKKGTYCQYSFLAPRLPRPEYLCMGATCEVPIETCFTIISILHLNPKLDLNNQCDLLYQIPIED